MHRRLRWAPLRRGGAEPAPLRGGGAAGGARLVGRSARRSRGLALPGARALLAAAALLLALPRPGAAQEFSNVYFFGDSLTDTGLFCSGLSVLGQGYASESCSNGEIWADVLAGALGVELDVEEESFANGGDTTSDLDFQIDAFELSLLLQFEDVDPDALYVIWLGSNDVLAMPSSPTAMSAAVGRIVDGIERLADLGAEHFLVPNLVDVGRAWGHFDFDFPEVKGDLFAPEERADLTELSSEFNALLGPALLAIPGVTIGMLDVHALLEDIFAAPSSFGFSPDVIDTTTQPPSAFGIPCLEVPACADDPQGAIADGFILFDALHPTTAAHAIIGEEAVRVVLPEPRARLGGALAVLAAVGFAGRRGLRASAIVRS